MFSVSLLLLALQLSALTQAQRRFPDGFMFGAGTAAYQVEGGWNADGKGESVWDKLFHEHPEYTYQNQTGDVADDSYHHYREDVQLAKDMGLTHYRFSISWPRILPTGETTNINQAGIQYYNNLIDDVLANGIQPFVTIYHWDLPQSLEDLGGWTNPIIPDFFEDYAKLLFENFGDRVKWWITLNEPLSFIQLYTTPAGEADYLAAYHALIAHARVYHLYDEQYRAAQQGQVSITLDCNWQVPLTNSSEDIAAAERALQFGLGLFAHPIHSSAGDFPPLVREIVDNNSRAEGRTSSRLPVFSNEMVDYVKGTADFFALNSYTTFLVTSSESEPNPSRARDQGTTSSNDPSWPISANTWAVVPWGFRNVITWVHQNYNAPRIIITENGYANNGTLDDQDRIDYFKGYLGALLDSVYEDGSNVIGYTAWSLIDTLEWVQGYSIRFGLNSVNISDPARPRTPKASAKFMKDIISAKELPSI